MAVSSKPASYLAPTSVVDAGRQVASLWVEFGNHQRNTIVCWSPRQPLVWAQDISDFSGSGERDVRFYFPAEGEQPPGVAGRNVALCGHCGHIHAGHDAANATCTSCGEGEPVPAFCPETLTASANRTILSRDCPFCNASEALIIVGARARCAPIALASRPPHWYALASKVV